MDLDNISISKFQKMSLPGAIYYKDKLIITDHLEAVEQFKFACRIDAITILICLDGEINCRINLKEYKIKANEIFISFPENIIQIESVSNLSAYAMLISSDYLKELQIEFKQKLNSYLTLKERPLTEVPFNELVCLKYYYYLIKENLGKVLSESENIVRGLLLSFVYQIISIINVYQKCDNDNGISNKSRIQQSFEKFMSLLAAYHSREHTVKFYASKMNLTANYLSNIVKKYSGKTAADWINDYIILEAKALLKFSDMNIQEIAYKLNFSSQSAFGKYFKQQTGIAPKFYVKNT